MAAPLAGVLLVAELPVGALLVVGVLKKEGGNISIRPVSSRKHSLSKKEKPIP